MPKHLESHSLFSHEQNEVKLVPMYMYSTLLKCLNLFCNHLFDFLSCFFSTCATSHFSNMCRSDCSFVITLSTSTCAQWIKPFETLHLLTSCRFLLALTNVLQPFSLIEQQAHRGASELILV